MPFVKGEIPVGATPFKKGKSGNSLGRRKKLPDLDILLADVLGKETNGINAAQAIIEALQAKAAKGDVRAAEVLLDRAWSKIKHPIANEIHGNMLLSDLPIIFQ